MNAQGLTTEELLAGIPDPALDALVHSPPAVGGEVPEKLVTKRKLDKAIDPVMLGALALDIAQGYDAPETIAKAYNLDVMTFERLTQSPAFQRELDAAKSAVQSEGGLAQFRLRCRMAAEQLLPRMTSGVYLAGASLSEVVSAFKAVSELADLKPREAKEQGSGGVTINFQLPNLPGLPNTLVVETQPQPKQPGPPIDVEPMAAQPAYGFDFGSLPDASKYPQVPSGV